MKKESFKERLFDFLSDVWYYFLLPIIPTAGFLCLPSVVHLLGFSKVAFIGFIALMILLGLCFLHSLVLFLLGKRDENVTLMNRCVWIWIVCGIAALIATFVTKLVGLL